MQIDVINVILIHRVYTYEIKKVLNISWLCSVPAICIYLWDSK